MADLQAQIDELRTELAQLREQLATEVRTRKVVVVGPDGFERVALEAWNDSGCVTVNGRGDTMDPPVIMLYASEEHEAGPLACIMVTSLDGHTGGQAVIEGSDPAPEIGLHLIEHGPDGWIPRVPRG